MRWQTSSARKARPAESSAALGSARVRRVVCWTVAWLSWSDCARLEVFVVDRDIGCGVVAGVVGGLALGALGFVVLVGEEFEVVGVECSAIAQEVAESLRDRGGRVRPR